MTGRALLLALLVAAIPALAEIQISSIYSHQPDIAWNGSKFGVIYWREVALDPLVLVTIDKAGTNPGPEIVSMGISAPQTPVIVAGPGVWAAAWMHPEVDSRKIYFAAFDDDEVLGVVWQNGPANSAYIYFESVPTSHILVGGGAGAGNPATVSSP